MYKYFAVCIDIHIYGEPLHPTVVRVCAAASADLDSNGNQKTAVLKGAGSAGGSTRRGREKSGFDCHPVLVPADVMELQVSEDDCLGSELGCNIHYWYCWYSIC